LHYIFIGSRIGQNGGQGGALGRKRCGEILRHDGCQGKLVDMYCYEAGVEGRKERSAAEELRGNMVL